MSENTMDSTAEAVVENENLSLMPTDGAFMAPVEQITGDVDENTMPGPAATPTVAGMGQSGGFMDPVGSDEPPTFEAPPTPLVDADDVGDGYLRLLVHLENGAISVIGASIVDGPLVELEPTGDMMYQVLIDGVRIGSGGLPDLEVQRGLGAPDQTGSDDHPDHGFGTTDSADFVVRIPRQDVTEADLARIEIELVRPTETAAAPAPGETIQAEATAAGRDEPDLVARLVGLDFSSVPAEEAERVRRRLR